MLFSFLECQISHRNSTVKMCWWEFGSSAEWMVLVPPLVEKLFWNKMSLIFAIFLAFVAGRLKLEICMIASSWPWRVVCSHKVYARFVTRSHHEKHRSKIKPAIQQAKYIREKITNLRHIFSQCLSEKKIK